MKLLFIPTGNAPSHYSFDGDVVTAHHDGQTESFDLSALTASDQFQGVELDTLTGPAPSQVIRDAYRDEAGELHVTLCQQVVAGQYPGMRADWRTGNEIDASQYDPNVCYCVPTGMVGVTDYRVAQGTDVAGTTGWTVVKETPDGNG